MFDLIDLPEIAVTNLNLQPDHKASQRRAVLTNLMSAGATVAVIGPVVLDMAVSSGTNPVLVGVGLAIATSMAYWLVIGTPASSIVYASGQLESKDFIRMATLGWPAALIALSAIVILWWVNVLGINPSGTGF